MYPKYRKWLFLAIVALIPILSGCDGCDKKKYVAPPPAPSAPSNLNGSAVSSTEIDLAWKDNSTNERGFYVYRRTTGSYARVAIMEANATSYSDSGLSPETTYRYKVKAYNDGGESGSSNEVSITTPAGPTPPLPPLQPPSDMTATAASYKQINLSWRDNSDDEDSFRIACDMGVGQNQFLDRVAANTTRYEHGNLQPMTEYKYYVVAERGGESAGSEQFSAITLSAPVEILEYSLDRASMCIFYLRGYLKSSATEPCLVELTAQYHITADYYEFSEWETYTYTVDLEALADNTFFEFWYGMFTEPRDFPETCGDKNVDCELEITDVEIEY